MDLEAHRKSLCCGRYPWHRVIGVLWAAVTVVIVCGAFAAAELTVHLFHNLQIVEPAPVVCPISIQADRCASGGVPWTAYQMHEDKLSPHTQGARG